MKKIKRIFAFHLVLLLLTSCYIEINSVRGSGKVVNDLRPVRGITGVTLATFGDLEIIIGEDEALEIEAEDNLIEYFETDVQAGVLSITTRTGTNLQATRPVRYRLTVKELDFISITSSGSITGPAFESDRFTIDISSSGNARLAGVKTDSLRVHISSSGNLDLGSLQAESLRVDISSSGSVTIDEGQVSDQDITISSSGEYRGGEVRSETATVHCSSSGNATLWVMERLDASLNSSGDVRYYGDPRVNQTTNSSGRVQSLGEK